MDLRIYDVRDILRDQRARGGNIELVKALAYLADVIEGLVKTIEVHDEIINDHSTKISEHLDTDIFNLDARIAELEKANDAK